MEQAELRDRTGAPTESRRWGALLVERSRAVRHLRHIQHGSRIQIVGKPLINNRGTLIIGDDCVLRSVDTPIHIYVSPVATMIVGQGVTIDSGGTFSAFLRLEIGDRVRIGTHVTIHDNSFHDLYDRKKVPESRPVIIEDDVWLQSTCTVLPGVRVGRGAVVEPHSLVNRDVDPFTVVAGVPARPVMELDPDKFVV
jgi:acetyltransferase-like isoleucine patch superfamily enzyme